MLFNYMVRNKDVLQSFADDLRIQSCKTVHGYVTNTKTKAIERDNLSAASATRDLCAANSLHGPFFVDLIDSYVYMCENVDDERDESNRLHNAIDVLNTMRQSNASVSYTLYLYLYFISILYIYVYIYFLLCLYI